MVDLSIITQPITIPDFTDITEESRKIIEFIPNGTKLVINDVGEQEKALNVLRDVRSLIKKGEAKFKAIKDPMNTAKNAVLALEHEMIDPIKSFEKIISSANSDFILRQQREAERIAREQTEKERRDREERALAEAAVVESEGDSERAEAIIETAITAPRVVVPPIVQTARVQGVQSRASYSATVTDLRKLVEHCLANPELLPVFISANEVALNAQARAMKEAFNIPGCEVVKKYV